MTFKEFRREYLCPLGLHSWTRKIKWYSGRIDKHCKCCPALSQKWSKPMKQNQFTV